MDIEQVKKIPLPPGESGEFLFTHEMANQFGLDILEDLVAARSVELGINLQLSISEKRQGFLISWRPA